MNRMGHLTLLTFVIPLVRYCLVWMLIPKKDLCGLNRTLKGYSSKVVVQSYLECRVSVPWMLNYNQAAAKFHHEPLPVLPAWCLYYHAVVMVHKSCIQSSHSSHKLPAPEQRQKLCVLCHEAPGPNCPLQNNPVTQKPQQLVWK